MGYLLPRAKTIFSKPALIDRLSWCFSRRPLHKKPFSLISRVKFIIHISLKQFFKLSFNPVSAQNSIFFSFFYVFSLSDILNLFISFKLKVIHHSL